MRRPTPPKATVVVKIGSSSLTLGKPGLDLDALRRVVGHVATLRRRGHPGVLVTSAAVAAGLPALGVTSRPSDVPGLQAAAAVGQSRLMQAYTEAFDQHDVTVGQILLSRNVLADRDQYLHARQAFERLLELGVVPIVNENDTVAIEELRLGDNDRLAAIVGHLVNAGLLLLLTDTSGLFSADPRTDEGATLLRAIEHNDAILDGLTRGTSGPLGSGGVSTKIAAARMAAWSGIPTVIAPADAENVALEAVEGDEVGTWIEPRSQRLPARKLWIAFGQPSEGRIVIDAGARTAITSGGSSLLPVGVTAVEGDFAAGAAAEVAGPDGHLVAKGVSRFDAESLRRRAGHRSESGEVAIHRDDMIVLTP
ncbi:MAG: glutamate 5-kinase [Acidimicrobiia bacterium]|nr:glutamate 5-kinase [Acidimicrobiia bacterium]